MLNCMSLNRSDVQCAAKAICTKMADPARGSSKRLKKACTHLRGVEKVTWSDAGVEARPYDRGFARGPGLG